MATKMKPEQKRFDHPDEVRAFTHGRSDVATVGGVTLGRLTLEPGWHWKDDVAPIAGTPTCEVEHVQFVVSGRLRVALDSGEIVEAGAGDIAYIPPGHDAWVLGSEPFVGIELLGAEKYAKGRVR